MTKKQRRFLFWTAMAIFLLLSTGVLTFAFGFRYDFSHHRLVKTGSIVLKPNTEAAIFINGKLAGRTSFLKGTFSQKRLRPGNYLVRVEKNKFAPWQKEIEVKEGLVSDLSRIVLFSRGQVEKEIINRSHPLSISREQQKAVYWEKNTLAFYDFNGSNRLIYKSEPLVLEPAALKFIWSLDGKEVLAFDKSKAIYFDLLKNTSVDLGASKQYSLDSAFLKDSHLYFLKSSPKLSGKDLVSLSLKEFKLKVVSKNIVSFLINKDGVFAISGAPATFLKMGLNGENEKTLGKLVSFDSVNIKKVISHNGVDFVLVGSNLYSSVSESDGAKIPELTLVANWVQGFSISPDGFVLGWHTDREFWVEWIKDTEYQPFKKAGERQLVFKTEEDVKSFDWYRNSNYIFLELAKNLTVVEVDPRGVPNKYKLLSLASQERAWYDLDQNKIFKLSNLKGLATVEIP